MRTLANPNFFFTDTIISNCAISIFTYNMLSRIVEKNKKIVKTLKEFDGKRRDDKKSKTD